MNFAENLRNARKAAGLSQKQVADVLKVHRTVIARYEAGDCMPSVEHIGIMCKLFNITFEELLEA